MSKSSYNIADCKILQLNKHFRPNGNLTAVESGSPELGFEIKRVYYIYDVPSASERGGHAHKKLFQMVLAASGCFDVVIDDGKHRKVVTLNRPDRALILPPGIWREMNNFSSGAITLVLASEPYDEEDYIRQYSRFLDYRNHK